MDNLHTDSNSVWSFFVVNKDGSSLFPPPIPPLSPQISPHPHPELPPPFKLYFSAGLGHWPSFLSFHPPIFFIILKS